MGIPERRAGRRAGDVCVAAVHRTRNPVTRGFTVMELLIVVALAALILALGAPQFGEFQRNNRLTATANDLLASLQLARTEAIKRQRPVALCASADPVADTPSCSGGAFRGWIVFEDPDADCQPGSADAVLRREGPIPASLRVRADGQCTLFGADGFSRQLGAGVDARRLVVCDDRGYALQAGTDQSTARGIQVLRPGRAFVTREPDLLEGWDLACP